uniref:Putative secreted protein n=1 Tax=Anopheles darlingi TaxID=43151 RepID=A0A2M4DLE4_ANODA
MPVLHLEFVICISLSGGALGVVKLLERFRCGGVLVGEYCFKHSTSLNTTCAPPPLVGITSPLYSFVSSSPSVSASCEIKQYLVFF